MTEAGKKALELHKNSRGKLETKVKVPLTSQEDLLLAYTPGVADVAMACSIDSENAYVYTMKQTTVAVVTDGSSVLGLGNIGPLGAYPVMEGKAALFKRFANLDAFPICLSTQEPEEIIAAVRAIAPSFGAILLEDIAAPKCFLVEERLQDLGIPVMHDDQHGTAVVVRAALINAAKVVGKDFSKLSVVISGGGAAGQATGKLLIGDGNTAAAEKLVGDLIVVDSKGIISEERTDLDPYKQYLATRTNKQHKKGDLTEALKGADVFIGLSRGNIATTEMIQGMAKDPIVFALSNPEPEITRDKAIAGGAKVVATGRSDLPNQVNNLLGFPGIFLGAVQARAKTITPAMLLAASDIIAEAVKNPTADEIVPSVFTEHLFDNMAAAVKIAAQ